MLCAIRDASGTVGAFAGIRAGAALPARGTGRPGTVRRVMSGMPAAVYTGDGNVAVETLPIPEPAAGEALVEVSHCGICGTDLHLVLEQHARPGSVLGHEWAGTVVAVGDNADEHVGRHAHRGPTRTRMRRLPSVPAGRPAVCLRKPPPDHFAGPRRVLSLRRRSDRALFAIPTLATHAAALTEPTAYALHTVRLSGVEPGKSRAGDERRVRWAAHDGSATRRWRRRHHRVGAESGPPRSRAGIGAKHVVTPDALPSAPMGRCVPEPYTVAFECSGHASAAEAALDQLDYAGTLVFVGTGRELPRVNHNRTIVLELMIIGHVQLRRRRLPRCPRAPRVWRVALDALIEPDDITLDELLPTMHRLAAGELPGKVMVRPETR